MLTILLTDGAFTGLIRALREAYTNQIRIIGLSQDKNTAHQIMLDAFYVVPHWADEDYFDVLYQILKKEKVDIILPIISQSLETMALQQDTIKKETHASVLISSSTSIKIANDKAKLYDFLKQHPNPTLRNLVPEYYLASSPQQLLEKVQLLIQHQKTACIKKTRGEDAAGFWIIKEQAYKLEDLINHSPKRVLPLSMLEETVSLHWNYKPWPDYMSIEYLPGEEWDCDVLCQNGILLDIITRKNLEMMGGLTSVLEVLENPELEEYCRLIVKALDLSYVACISFKMDPQGNFKLLEINPRMMGNIYVSALAGNNFAALGVQLFQNKPLQLQTKKTNFKTALFYDQAFLP